MTFDQLREQVLDVQLCTSCGACAAVCPEDIIEIGVDVTVPRLRLDPRVSVADACGTCTLCSDACPGRDTGVDRSEQRIFGRRRVDDERWTGIIRRTLLASAHEDPVRAAASAGGAATALLVAALRTGAIDAALVIGRDPERPWVPVPRLADTVEEIVACAQATYCITPNLQLLRDAPYRRIGVVGLPCQIEAINKLRNLDDPPAAVRPVAFTIELACSSNTERAGTEHLIRDRLHLPLTAVRQVTYRAGDYPGAFTVHDADGAVHTLPFHEIVMEFRKFKTFRCLNCPDWWSGLADASVADGDPNIFKTSRNEVRAAESSMLVTRTEVGDELVDLAVRERILDVVDAEFRPEESLGLQRKRHRYLRNRSRHPDRVPTAPMDREEEPHGLASDEEVIERMSARERAPGEPVQR